MDVLENLKFQAWTPGEKRILMTFAKYHRKHGWRNVNSLVQKRRMAGGSDVPFEDLATTSSGEQHCAEVFLETEPELHGEMPQGGELSAS